MAVIQTLTKEAQIAELRAKQANLVTRLDAGAEKIENGKFSGVNPKTIEGWEDFWMNLLQEYEDVCVQIHHLEHPDEG
jgi:hypothetical protein